MKIGLDFVLGVAYIAFVIGVACDSVGRTYQAGIYTCWLPIKVLMILGAPFGLGLLAGRKSKD